MAKRVTIHDVAALAGVSRQTVTRALNDMDGINDETKQRVLEVSKRLGYRPSRFARSLVAREKTRTLGLVVSSFRNPYYTEIAGELLDCAASRNWQVIMASSESAGEAAAVRTLSTQVDVVVGHFWTSQEQIEQARNGVPVVVLDRVEPWPGMHSVALDLRPGIEEAIRALRGKGARSIGMIDSNNHVPRHSAYVPSTRRRDFEELIGPGRAAAVVAGEESIGGGSLAFVELMRAHPEVDAVLVFNDLMAIGAVHAAHTLAIDVPGRVRILGIDGLSMGQAVHPPLSTISIDRAALAARALDVVDALAAVDFAETAPIRHVVRPRLLWRESA
ncbi:LacI family DNA-binding transcriptional regulator [Nonomuraea phyllanthi]|uniref:LacI family DNA-binding transcriptional regulator n=1 Tax=Nonomuraea phyllanthi TaxID=2219224 RepID=A0A5C4V236_9ACTN|nr:LacI family DNA-binding transcriptional regulator [Nonomuraea phyllanthi]KAB8185163.1 LacI family DNA-binding transcriptional regulator [Nonomuraea phyllanthi]QFY13394.1 LacI family DNA-binding transcriptional regulator [Nonomuraea phyllanthi]